MSLRAPDIRDEHGWQIVADNGPVTDVIGWAPSRDTARAYAKDPSNAVGITFTENGRRGLDPRLAVEPSQPVAKEEIQVLPADDSPEAVLAAQAFKVSERIKQTAADIRGLWVDLAADLYLFKEGRMWEALGCSSLDEYCADPDVEIGVRHAYDLIAAYKQLVVDRGLDPSEMKQLEVSKVKEALPAIRREQVTMAEAVSDIKTLSKSSIILKYSGRASSTPGVPDTKTKIETDKEPVWGVCDVCGTRKQMDPETGRFIK